MKTLSSSLIFRSQAGLTLIEIMVVLLVVSVGLVATAKFQGDLLHEGGTNKARIQALSHALDKVEELRIDHDSAAGGNGVETGSNAQYSVAWTVGTFAGIADAQRHNASVTWTDTLNRSQTMTLSSVVYPDRLYTDPEGAADCIYGKCTLEDPDPPEVDIDIGAREDLNPSGPSENWPGIENPTEDTTGDSGTSGDDKIYESGHLDNPLNLQSGDDQIYINKLLKSELYAGSGDDQIEVKGNSESKVYLDAGDDIFKTHGHLKDEIHAGAGDDLIIIGKHMQSKAYLGSGDDYLYITQHLKDEVYADSGDDYVYVGHHVQNKIYMGDGDDFLVIVGNIENEVHGSSGEDSLCLEGYSSSNWDDVEEDIYSFENIKTSNGVIVKGSGDPFGDGCERAGTDGGEAFDYKYPITLTITPATGYPQVDSIILDNKIAGTNISGATDNGDGTYTVLVDINDQAKFDLLSDEQYADDGLIVEVSSKWVQREAVVTVTLKEAP